MSNILISIYKNPVGRTFLGLIFAFLFGISALFLSIFYSSHLGDMSTPYDIKETYKFDSWVINYDFLTLDFPQGGYVVPGYQNDRISSVLIIAEGRMKLDTSDSFKLNSDLTFPMEDTISEVIIPIHHEDFDRLKKDTIFIQEEINYPIDYLKERFDSASDLFFRGNILGVEKIIPPKPRTVLLKINSAQFGYINYKEDSIVTLTSETVGYSFSHPIGHRIYPPKNSSLAMVIYNLLLSLAFLGLIAFLTTDIDNKSPIKTGHLDSLSTTLHMVGFLGYVYLIKWLSITYYLESVILIILYLLPVCYLIYCMITAKVSMDYLGIKKEKVIKSIMVSIVIFYLWFITATFEIFPTSTYDSTSLVKVLIIVFLGQIILRGFIQTTLELVVGKWLGLFLSSFLIMVLPLINYLGSFNSTNWLLTMMGYFAITLITSYSFQRTRNILTPTLLTILFSLVIPHMF
ncbi:CPBP family intramembrane metalloprotease [Alkalicella caledoniensis]|uniref:CPBP family intramembrane metalloprotease n=1 Tax=Alkalicella caledoniensis TaxID=2731377 RepID=A0A7G9W839_ALKCA|nr:CPBP family intramembrane glutamic endopeptidase [Alkalicella caledoniensis]QNO14851.1 CPBP family intramembrane metalloprotease [Alkalicella caledoniensis]